MGGCASRIRVTDQLDPVCARRIENGVMDPKDIVKTDGWSHPVAIRAPYGHSGAIDDFATVSLRPQCIESVVRFM